MEPPWKKYPELQKGRIGWRMGYGEEYLNDFTKWFGWLDPAAQGAFEVQHPEHEDWQGFYERTKAHPWPRPHTP